MIDREGKPEGIAVSLQNMTTLLSFVRDGQAIAAFNFIDLDDLRGIVCAAEHEQTPVILQVSQSTAKHLGLDYAAGMARVAARRSRVPLCLHLDHASGIDIICEAIECGFTSVMYDGSALPFEDNLDFTARVVEMAHAAGVSVEAELGIVGGKEEAMNEKTGEETAGEITGGMDEGIAREIAREIAEEMTGDPGKERSLAIHGHPLTDPLQSREFVLRTGIDALAPAVGTAHGLYRGAPHIAFDLISAIRDLVNVPLVLHGGSDIPEELLRKAIRAGIRKVNVGTDLQVAHAQALRRALPGEGEVLNMRATHAAAVDAVCAVARAKIAICSGRGAS